MLAVKRFYCLAVSSSLLFFFFLILLGYKPHFSSNISHAFHSTAQDPNSDIYTWTSHSEFGFPEGINASTASHEQLCAYFPTHVLAHIQPVLKTGHGVIDTRLASQLKSVSACFGEHLLIFSDKNEVYQNHSIIDLIGEIPKAWRDEHAEQFLAYDALHNSSIVAPNNGAWKIDKFKFLVEMSTTWRMRPGRNWYVFYEGDTYIFWDNVFRYLEHFDPDKPWYFGSPSPARQDPKTKKKTWFGNGGPGFILSREALRRITKDDWDPKTGEFLGSMLTRNYWDELVGDCCGDSVLGWSLYEHKIPVGGLWPMMNPHGPERVPFEDQYWCQPIMSFHKPPIDKMEELWRWQWTARRPERPLLFRDLALSYHQIDTWTTRNNWRNEDWGAIELPDDHQGHVSIEHCKVACKANNHCFQWTFQHPGHCTLVNNFRGGRAVAPEKDENGEVRSWTAGWMTQKIHDWAAARPCDQVQWVKPSSTRVF